MKNYQFVLSFLLIFLIISCSKDTVVSPNPTDKICLVQKAVYSDGSSDEYTFDNLNRLTKSVFKQDTILPETVYTYIGKTVVASFEGITFSTGYLNGKGFLDSTLFSIPNYSDFKIINAFNSNWQLVSQKTSGIRFGDTINEITTYQYLGGNLIKETFNDGKTITTYDYEYYLDKVNHNKKSMEAVNFHNSNVNLVKKATSSSGNTVDYTYEFDKDGKVTKSTKILSGNYTDTTITTYTWICK